MRFSSNAGVLTYEQAIQAWQNDAEFRSFFGSVLKDADFESFRWETPPLTNESATRIFECVVIDNPGLARHPDSAAFAEHFTSGNEEGIATFPNLGGDAIMVVPCPRGPEEAYGHLAAFMRNAPEPQRHALWRAVGSAMQRRLSSRPVWLSTAGAGVSWLHIRLDDRPKYYSYAPYRSVGE